MISYELAKQLKDSGWKNFQDIQDDKYLMNNLPTLSELIEACGDEFYSVRRCIDKFPNPTKVVYKASSIMRETQPFIQIDGSTPEEAVALLYLKLNK